MNCINSSNIIFQQIKALLLQLNDDQYSKPLVILNGSSIGKHTRHIIEFYQCIIDADPARKLDYSCRLRNLEIENITNIALDKLVDFESSLKSLNEQQLLSVVPDFDSTKVQVKEASVTSSVGRELMYAYDHAIHHLAIIKIGVKETFPELEVSDSLGVAPSTIRYENSINT